ncbi:MAG: phospholipase D-like domain-containing protein [Flavitalea sp.]
MPETKNTTTHTQQYTRHNRVKLVRGGKEYFTLLHKLIRQAKYSIHLQVYIFDEDETGKEIADALIEAAARKVDVYLLIDGYASAGLSAVFRKRFTDSGIHFRMFKPLLKTSGFYFGRRMHRKMTIVDCAWCLVGGINISNRYNDVGDTMAWLDWALYAEGEIAADLLKISLQFWTRSESSRQKLLKLQQRLHEISGICLVRARANDWVKSKTQITRSYSDMIKHAKSHITIMSSYFIPGELIRKKLERAARRKVKIQLILAGNSDIRISKYAERYIYRWALRKGIEIFEYQPTVLHGKIATYDDLWTTAGSYNVNNISAFASLELNLDVQDAGFAQVVRHQLNDIIKKDCLRITPEDYRTKYNAFNRLLQWSAYNTVRILFFLFTFYFRQRR